MKLVMAIVQDEYIDGVIEILMDNKIRTTKLASTGGFLKSGNTTLLLGVEDDEVQVVVDLIRKVARTKNIKKGKDEYSVGGANIFVVEMDEFIRI